MLETLLTQLNVINAPLVKIGKDVYQSGSIKVKAKLLREGDKFLLKHKLV